MLVSPVWISQAVKLSNIANHAQHPPTHFPLLSNSIILPLSGTWTGIFTAFLTPIGRDARNCPNLAPCHALSFRVSKKTSSPKTECVALLIQYLAAAITLAFS
jgi:hypothetical protein